LANHKSSVNVSFLGCHLLLISGLNDALEISIQRTMKDREFSFYCASYGLCGICHNHVPVSVCLSVKSEFY